MIKRSSAPWGDEITTGPDRCRFALQATGFFPVELFDEELGLTADSMRGISLTTEDLSGADLRGADLRGLDLSCVDSLTAEQLRDAKIDGTTMMPPGLEYLARRVA